MDADVRTGWKGKLLRGGLLALMVLSSAASAQSGGFYETIRYRDNDPFLFCTKGYEMTIAQMCWIPLNPQSGTWTYTGVCRPPNKYGRDWNERDYDALSQYQRICPRAMGQGPWQGPGDGSQSPYTH